MFTCVYLSDKSQVKVRKYRSISESVSCYLSSTRSEPRHFKTHTLIEKPTGSPKQQEATVAGTNSPCGRNLKYVDRDCRGRSSASTSWEEKEL